LFILPIKVLKHALSIAESHLVFVEGAHRLFQVLSFRLCLSQGFTELVHLLLKRLNDFIVLLDIVLDVLQTLLEDLNELKHLTSNLVVVVLHFFETSLVVHHEVVSVLVLSLLNLMDLHLHTQFQLLLQLSQLDLVAVDEVFLLQLQLRHQVLHGVLESLLLLFSFRDVVDIFASVLILLLSFILTVLVFLGVMVLLLILHLLLGLALLSLAVVQVVIVQMLDLLHVRGDLGAVVRLLVLHCRV